MKYLVLLFLVSVVELSTSTSTATDLDRQSSYDKNYDKNGNNYENFDVNRYRSGEYGNNNYYGGGASAGYYPRTAYDQYGQNRYNDPNIKNDQFGQNNIYSSAYSPAILATPHYNPMLAHQQQYPLSAPSSGYADNHQSGAPFLQSPRMINPYFMPISRSVCGY